MNKQTVLFLGSKPIGYHCLAYLIQEQSSLNIDIIGLLSNDNSRFDSSLSLKQLAAQHAMVIYEDLDSMPEADFIISVQFHEILKPQHIAKAKQLAVNLHMAPLPEYRGCNQFSFAIDDECKVFGTTLHKMDAGIDHGDIIAEQRFAIPDNCWVEELYQLTYDASLALFKTNIESIIRGNYTLTPQHSLVSERGTSMHYRKEMDTLKQIDLNWDEEKIMRRLRATAMPGFEPPYAMVNNQKIYLSREWVKK